MDLVAKSLDALMVLRSVDPDLGLLSPVTSVCITGFLVFLNDAVFPRWMWYSDLIRFLADALWSLPDCLNLLS